MLFFGTYVYKSKSKRFIIILCSSKTSDEVRYLDLQNPDRGFQLFMQREKGHEYSISHRGDYFYIRTNKNAQNFCLMRCPIDKTGTEHWENVVPHRPDVLLEHTTFLKDFMVLEERKDGLSQLHVLSYDQKIDYYIEVDDPAYMIYSRENFEPDSNVFRYGYQSMTTPISVYDIDLTNKEKSLLKRQEVIGDFKPEDYKSERLFAKAKDGQIVPISLVYRKDKFQQNGQNPLHLYSYGSYGHSMEPYFSSIRLSLLDRRFVCAIAHIRGGEDMGRQWYEEGKFLKKKNTFTDFISCAEHLLENNYTSSDRLVIEGGSAGGLLMGAVMNMRPDLFKAVCAAVPFVDVVTTMLDESIPLTTGEYEEWGNPNEKEFYDYMLSYSPYDNVKAQDYPNLLVTSGINDSQVHYWEPAKWVAKLREMKTDNNTLLFKINLDAGHGGASGRSEGYKERAFEYAFMLDMVGIKE